MGDEPAPGLLKAVTDLKSNPRKGWEAARNNLRSSQLKMKTWYDKWARVRIFQEGDKVLVLLSVQGQPLQAKFRGPYEVLKRVGTVNYIISTPDRRKSQRLCHVNMLKHYLQRDCPSISTSVPVLVNSQVSADATE